MVEARGERFLLVENFRIDVPPDRAARHVVDALILLARDLMSAAWGLARTTSLLRTIVMRRDCITVTCNGGVESLVIAAVLKYLRRPVVVDFVDFAPLQEPPATLPARIRRWTERRTLKLANLAVFISEEDRLRSIQLGLVPASATLTIPYGLADQAALNARDSCRRHASDRHAIVVGWEGSLFFHAGYEANNLQSLIDGLCLLIEEHGVRVDLLLIGPRPDDIAAHRLLTGGLPVRCTGPFQWGSRDHWSIMAQCDAFALPVGTHLRNANRAKLFDYMAASRPIIAVSTREVERVLGEFGLYVDGSPRSWAVALDRLVTDPQLSDVLACGARSRLTESFVASRLAPLLDRAITLSRMPEVGKRVRVPLAKR